MPRRDPVEDRMDARGASVAHEQVDGQGHQPGGDRQQAGKVSGENRDLQPRQEPGQHPQQPAIGQPRRTFRPVEKAAGVHIPPRQRQPSHVQFLSEIQGRSQLGNRLLPRGEFLRGGRLQQPVAQRGQAVVRASQANQMQQTRAAQ